MAIKKSVFTEQDHYCKPGAILASNTSTLRMHVGAFPEMEDQLCTWDPLSGDASPDRLDARVWAITELMLGPVEQNLIVPSADPSG